MAGSTIIDSTQLSDFHQILAFTLNGTLDIDTHLFYAERDTVIESAFVVYATGDTNNDATFALRKGSSGDIVNGTLISNAILLPVGSVGTPVAYSLVAGENIIPAGSWVGVDVNGTSTASHLSITLRVRTRII